jgi:uncharacterized membrane protein
MRQQGKSRLILSTAEAEAIDARIAHVEAHTGVQIVAAVVARCDGYPEVVWKAFALGAALAALVVVALDFARPDWMSLYAALSNVLPIIGAGAVSAALGAAVPAYARLFVNRFRADSEVRQHAQAMFLTRQLFRTRGRNGVLLLAGLFEHKVEVLADIGFDGRIVEREWHSVVEAMTPLLAARRPGEAIARGLDELEKLLLTKGFRAGSATDDELSNQPIQDGGA